MNEYRYFHFTLGPVQSFVAQARRTRDFWAGSFLLSYFSGVAMLATREQGGEIMFPKVDEAFFHAMLGGSLDKPKQGNIPNRFKAKVPQDFSPKVVEKAVLKAWQTLARCVWDGDLAHLENSPTQEIWKRQVENFWEMSWAMSDDASSHDLLDRRKNWRTHMPPNEPGQKCSLMEGWQELSGNEVAQSKNQKSFWNDLKEKSNLGLDMGKNESLCAIAFIKRRFVHHFKNFTCNVGEKRLVGWEISPNVPSISLLASALWLEDVAKQKTDELKKFALTCKKEYGQAPLVELNCLKNIPREILYIDSSVFFDEKVDKEIKRARDLLFKHSKPNPFYAIVMMDGDNLGKHMSNPDLQDTISTSLNEFTRGVEKIVVAHDGFLIYAGGDDVLALLPLEKALSCAAAIRASYEEAFTKGGKKAIPTSISAAILCVHAKIPLHNLLHKAHHVLDGIAKEKAGRDALAVTVIKPGGEQFTWFQKWNKALDETKSVILETIAKEQRKLSDDPTFARGFFYRIREILQIVEGVGSEEDKVELLAVEYRAGTDITQEKAKEIIRPLLKQCTTEKEGLSHDGALLVRFLAQKGETA